MLFCLLKLLTVQIVEQDWLLVHFKVTLAMWTGSQLMLVSKIQKELPWTTKETFMLLIPQIWLLGRLEKQVLVIHDISRLCFNVL